MCIRDSSTVVQSNTQQTYQPIALLEQQSLQKKTTTKGQPATSSAGQSSSLTKDQPTTPTKDQITTSPVVTPQKRNHFDGFNLTPTKSLKLSSPSSSNLIGMNS